MHDHRTKAGNGHTNTQARAATAAAGRNSPTLSRGEVRRIVAEMLG